MKKFTWQVEKIETAWKPCLGNTTRYLNRVGFISISSCLQKHHIERGCPHHSRFGWPHYHFVAGTRRPNCFWIKRSRVDYNTKEERIGALGIDNNSRCLGNQGNDVFERLLFVGAAESTFSRQVEGESQSQPSQTSKISFDTVLQELSSIQKDGPSNIAILGTRHCSLLHQQIVELLTYANVLIGNHIYTSGGGGTNSAAIRGALRAEKPHLLTVILPQSRSKQPKEAQELLKHVTQVIEMPHNDNLPLDVSSRLCNSSIISKCQQLISFVFHDSDVLLEAVKETKSLKKLVTLLYLD
ncbi:hypothetical protein GpartN1_g2156.t1 [Galdieria partita]|uniref:Uncharacterized protein n=1 Tax=Galdieria partita TaxID=83374 RepID=A0A9C7PTZ7_9RHOD|nr:hypothetical protein GpartN1_g2156.t1 [Galdieria partita]